MTHTQRIRLAGIACMVGGLIITVALLIPKGVVGDLVFTIMQLCLAGGPLGLLWLHAAGTGKLRIVGWIGAILTWLGLLAYMAGSVYVAANPEREFSNAFFPAGALLNGLGMCLMSVAVARARRLPGWHAFAVLPVGFYYFFMIPIQVIFFISRGLPPFYLLSSFWGIGWMLLGLVIALNAPQSAHTSQPPLVA